MSTWRTTFRPGSVPGRSEGSAAHATEAAVAPEATLAGWAFLLGRPQPEPRRSRRLAHLGGCVSILALALYLTWRIAFTMPSDGWNQAAAWTLVVFEALPLIGLFIRIVTLWDIDSRGPGPRHRGQAGPARRGVRPDLQRAGRGDRPDDRRGVRPPARARDVGAGRWLPPLGRGALHDVRRPLRQPSHARARQGRQHEPRDGPDGCRGGGRSAGHRHHRGARLRPRAAAALPDLDVGLVRRPRARARARAAVLLQLRCVRRRRRDRRAGHVLPRAAPRAQPRRRRTVLVRLHLADPGQRPARDRRDLHRDHRGGHAHHPGPDPGGLEDGLPPPDPGRGPRARHRRAVPPPAASLGHGVDAGAGAREALGRQAVALVAQLLRVPRAGPSGGSRASPPCSCS